MSAGGPDGRPTTKIRAGCSKHLQAKYVVGNFAMGTPSVLNEPSTEWRLHKDKPEVIPSRRRQPTPQQDATPWLLKNKAGTVISRGQLEGGIAASNYFVLIKEGDEFVAVPLTAWYNFKAPPRPGAMSLEDAEREMEKKHNSHFSGASRLSKAIAANEAQMVDAGPDEGGALGADSDEEEKRANRARAANADQSSAAEGRNQSAAADVNTVKGDKGAEDWEYEENAADDDEDMGEQDDLNNRDASPPPRQSPTASQEDEEVEGGNALTKHGKELQRLLKKSGLSESDDDVTNEDKREDDSLLSDDDDDDDDVEDLDDMAKGLVGPPKAEPPKAANAAETTRNRSPTPTSSVSKAAGVKRKAEGEQPAAKRKRSATPPTTQAKADAKPSIKKETTPSPAIKTEPTTFKPSKPVTAAEVRDFANSKGGTLSAKELSRHFKGRHETNEAKETFKNAVKEAGLIHNKKTNVLSLPKPK